MFMFLYSAVSMKTQSASHKILEMRARACAYNVID